MKISVIGAGGHVGLPFSIVCADADHDVVGIDVDSNRVLLLNSGIMPFKEEGADSKLKKYLQNGKLIFTTKYDSLSSADLVVIMVGTPVDGEGNPRLDDIMKVTDTIIHNVGNNRPEVILRSTVAPGTTELVARKFDEQSNPTTPVFIPERVVQGHGIEETKQFDWIVGTRKGEVPKKVLDLMKSIKVDYFVLSYKEAEIGKLMTNMYRYVNFAFANEMYMIGKKHGIDTFNMIEAFNHGYPRLNVPTPGPNVGGPCLFKDGKFLTNGFPFPELINTAFHINEGMPEFIFDEMMDHNPDIKRILILGASFKRDSDDIRNSLSFKMVKVCTRNGIYTHVYDPLVSQYSLLPKYLGNFDAAVVMTPHTDFYKITKDTLYLNHILSSMNEKAFIYDPWYDTMFEKRR